MPYIITEKAVNYDTAIRKAIKTLYEFVDTYGDRKCRNQLSKIKTAYDLAIHTRILCVSLEKKSIKVKSRPVKNAFNLITSRPNIPFTKEAP
jgi:hypothetical protein